MDGAAPAAWNRYFLPHYFGRFAPADFHGTFDADLHDLHTRRGSRLNYIAPRGGAKSTWVTLAYVLRAAVQRWESYTVILSDSAAQADELLRHVRVELEGNDRLADLYPESTGVGPEWNQNRIRLRNGAVIESLSTGKKIRGRRNRQARPSLVVLDDVQSNEDITSPTERLKAWQWVTREVLPAGDEDTNVIGVGSAIHREAVAVKLGVLPGWTGRTFKAVHRWPDRLDLWQEWERKATNLALSPEERKAGAAAFYAARKAEMDAGFAGYWPARYGPEAFVLRRAEIGPQAFEAEYQGVPSSGEGAEWPSSYFDRPGFWFTDWPALVARVQSLDPSKGSAAKPGDYQAHVRLGLAPDGTLYADADLRREPVPDMVARGVDLAFSADWGALPLAYAVEDNDALGLLLPEFDRECRRRQCVLPLKGVRNTVNKVVRVRRLGAYLAGGRIRVRDTPGGRLLVDQLRDFPGGEYDDGPDGLELAVRALEHLTLGR